MTCNVFRIFFTIYMYIIIIAMPAPTELPHVVQSVESTTNYSTDLTTQSLDTTTTTAESDLLSTTHGVTVDDLSTAVYICIAVAILLFVMAIILSVVIAVLSYKQRRLRALQRTKTLRRDSDEIWSASV